MDSTIAPKPETAQPQGLSALTKGLIGLVLVLVVVVIVVVVLAVTGKIGKGEEEPPPPPPDDGLFSCATIYLDPSSLTTQTPFSDTLPSYTFSNKALAYVAPPPTGSTGAGPKYYLTYNSSSGNVDKSVVLSATKSTEWSISPDGRITSSKAVGKCLSFSPGSSYVLLGDASVCDENPDEDVTCAFVYDGYSFYSRFYLENPDILDTAQILYWFDRREALSIFGVSLSKIGTTANCSNIGVEA